MELILRCQTSGSSSEGQEAVQAGEDRLQTQRQLLGEQQLAEAEPHAVLRRYLRDVELGKVCEATGNIHYKEGSGAQACVQL